MTPRDADDGGDLALADWHIIEGTARVARQAELVERQRVKDFSVARAEETLRLFQDILANMHAHRDYMLRQIRLPRKPN